MDLREPLQNETVADAGFRAAVSVSAETSVGDVMGTMREQQVGCVLVVASGALAGIFTERDLVVRVHAKRVGLDTPIAELMTKDPVVVRTSDPLGVALAHMHKGGFRHLPVVDTDGELRGTTSIKRMVHYLAECMPEAVLNLPPDPGKYPDTCEGG